MSHFMWITKSYHGYISFPFQMSLESASEFLKKYYGEDVEKITSAIPYDAILWTNSPEVFRIYGLKRAAIAEWECSDPQSWVNNRQPVIQ